MAKPFDPKAKAKRQKIIAGVLGLVLVGVLIFQAPTILGMFGGGSSSTVSEPAATPAPVPVTPAPGAPGAPAAATPTPVAVETASLVESDPAPTPTDGQLVTFDRFDSKDPFVQQVGDTPSARTSTPSVPVDSGAKADDPERNGGGAEPLQPVHQPAVTKTVAISVNGTAHEVAAGAMFPEHDPIFRLVSVRKGTAKVGIVGGSYADGSPTITLRKGGKPVTLMNTAEGTTYVLRFVG
jgi:hypothetical protein